jgi:hypothetical protein
MFFLVVFYMVVKSRKLKTNKRKSRRNYRGGDVISDIIKARIMQEEDIDPNTGEVKPIRYVDIANDIMEITKGHSDSFFSIYYDTALEHRAYRQIAKELKRLKYNQENEKKRVELEALRRKQEDINRVKRNLQYNPKEYLTPEEISDNGLLDLLEPPKRRGFW